MESSRSLTSCSHSTGSSGSSLVETVSSGHERKNDPWYFKDHQGNVQGPFKAGQMMEWLKMGYLSSHVAIAQDLQGPFHKLSVCFPDRQMAFQVEPRRVEDLEETHSEVLTEPSIDGTEAVLKKDEELEGEDWYFKDKHGAIQGPFSIKQMGNWARIGYFDDGSLQVRRGMGPNAVFQTISIGDDTFQELFDVGVGGRDPYIAKPPPIPISNSNVVEDMAVEEGGGHEEHVVAAQIPSSIPINMSPSSPISFASPSLNPSKSLNNSGGGSKTINATKQPRNFMIHVGASSNNGVNSNNNNSGSGKQQQSVKSRIFSRVTKHRRANSTGTSLSSLVKVGRHSQGGSGGGTSTNDFDGGDDTDNLFPNKDDLQKSPTSSTSSVSVSKFRTGGKKLLSVVTTPKYHGISITKYGGVNRSSKIAEETGVSAEDDGSSATAASSSVGGGGGHHHHRRLPSFATRASRYRQRRLRKKQQRQLQLGGSGGEDTDRTMDEYSDYDDKEGGGSVNIDQDDSDDDDDDDDEVVMDDDDDDDDDIDEFVEAESSDDDDSDVDREQQKINGGGGTSSSFTEGAPFGKDKTLTSTGSSPPPLITSTTQLTHGDQVTEHIHALLHSFRKENVRSPMNNSVSGGDHTTENTTGAMSGNSNSNNINTSSNPPMGTNRRKVQELQMNVAELQDENAQLREYIRKLELFAKEHSQDKKLPMDPPSCLLSTNTNPQQFGTVGLSMKQKKGVKSGKFRATTPSAATPPTTATGSSSSILATSSSTNEEEEIWEDFIVVEFDEDSPMLRKKLIAFEEGIEALRGELKDMIKSAVSYVESGADELDAALQLAEDLGQKEVRTLSPMIPFLHEMLKVHVNLKESVLDSIHDRLVDGIENFVKHDLRQANMLRKELQRARESYETLESKYMHHRRTKGGRTGVMSSSKHDAVGEQMLAELQSAKAKFELARFGLVQQINQLEAKKKFVIVDGVALCIQSLFDYFRHGYQVMASCAGSLYDARAEIAGTKEKFDVVVEKWNEKRIQLESQLYSGAFPFNSNERRKQTMLRPQEKVVVESRTSRTSHDPLSMHEGYLYKRSTSVRKDWKRRWFVLRSDKLLYYRSWKDPIPQPVCDILLCTVREVKNPELRCCFEIISPNQRAYVLQAVNELEMHTWMDAIRKAIETCLTKQLDRSSLPSASSSSFKYHSPDSVGGGLHHEGGIGSDENDEDHFIVDDAAIGMNDPEISKLLSMNPVCADCDTPNPDWVSLNLGIVICIACSGIHRSLGSHVSKVRSLTLDRLPRSQIRLLCRLGNTLSNKFLEYDLKGKKPSRSSPGEEKRAFIQAKYVEKRFLGRPDREQYFTREDFFTSVAEDDLEQVLYMILKGQAIDSHGSYVPNNLSEGSTALHIAASYGHAECIELLFLNGGCINNLNDLGETPLQVAIRYDHFQATNILRRLTKDLGSSSAIFDNLKPGSSFKNVTNRRRSRHHSSNSAPNSPVNPTVTTLSGGGSVDLTTESSVLREMAFDDHRPHVSN